MKNLKKVAVLLSMLLVVTSAFGACSKSTNSNDASQSGTTDSASSETNGDLSGTVTMAGSTSMEKLVNAAAEGFMEKYPKVMINPEFTGSGAGIEAVTAGTVDIGNSSRSLKDDEKSGGLIENIVAIDGIAVVVDKGNAVGNLTKDQLAQIYKGEINNWSAVGGADQPIVVIGRESGSGTRDAFEELTGTKDACKYSNEINSTGGVMAKVASTPGAIGYVSLDVVDDTVGKMSIDGVEATEETVVGRTYLLSRPFVMVTKGEISAQSETVQAFFAYLQSEDGQEIIKTVGLFLPNQQ